MIDLTIRMMRFRSDLRLALRQIVRAPGLCSLAMIAFALGTGANTAVFSYIEALLLRPLPYPDSDRLVKIVSIRGNETGKLIPREFEELTRRQDLFDSVAAYYPTQYNIADGGPPESAPSVMTTASLFRTLGIPLLHGGAWPDEFRFHRNDAVVLSYRIWTRRYGSDPSIVRRTITADAYPYQVFGVLPPGFDFPFHTDLFRGANLNHDQNRSTRSVHVIARLRRDTRRLEAERRLEQLASQIARDFPETNRGVTFRLIPLRSALVGDAGPYLWFAFGMTTLVLLIAASNVVNLLLSRAVARRKEMAIRSALGAAPRELLLQLMTESVVLALGGSALGLLLAAWGIRALERISVLELPSWMIVSFDAKVLVFSFFVSIVCGVLAGILPSMTAMRSDLRSILEETTRGGSSSRAQARLMEGLVAGQTALALALLIAGALLMQSFLALVNSDLGFRSDRLLTFFADPPYTKYGAVGQTALFYRRAQAELAKLPGVEAVAENHSLPLAGNDNYGKPTILVEGRSADQQVHNPFVNPQIVSPNYFRVMGIPLLRGRAFTDDDRAETQRVAVISRPLADQLFGKENPLLKRVRLVGLLSTVSAQEISWFTIVGIVGAVRSEGLSGGSGLDLYFSNQQQYSGDSYFVLRTSVQPESLAPLVARTVQRVDPEQSISGIRTMDDRIAQSVWQRRLAAYLSLAFGVLSLLLAMIGLYGVLSYSIGQQIREFGIRKALGAQPSQLIKTVVWRGMRPTMIGLSAGALLASVMVGLVRPLLVVNGTYIMASFGVLPIVLGMIAIAACAPAAVHAARADPAESLRSL
jgi:putative ABC transport system permease protein